MSVPNQTSLVICGCFSDNRLPDATRTIFTTMVAACPVQRQRLTCWFLAVLLLDVALTIPLRVEAQLTGGRAGPVGQQVRFANLVAEKPGQLVIGMLMSQHRLFNATTGLCTRPVGFEAAEDLETTKVMFGRLSGRHGAQASLGFQYYDSCSMSELSIAAIQTLAPQLPLTVDRCAGFRLSGLGITQRKLRRFIHSRNGTVVAFFGETFTRPFSGQGANVDGIPLLSLLGVPQVSHRESDPALDNKLEYPLFYRTSTSIRLEAKAIVDLLEHLQVKAFAIIASATKEEYLRKIVRVVQLRPLLQPVCIAFEARFFYDDRKSMRLITKQLQESKVKNLVVVLLARSQEADALLGVFSKTSNMPSILWIGNQDWSLRYNIQSFSIVKNYLAIGPPDRPDIAQDLEAVRDHFLSLTTESPELLLNVNLLEFWTQKFRCRLPSRPRVGNRTWPLCLGTEQLSIDTLPALSRAPSLILSLRALAKAVDQTLSAVQPSTDLNSILRNVSTSCLNNVTADCLLFNKNQGLRLEALRIYGKTSSVAQAIPVFDWTSEHGLVDISSRLPSMSILHDMAVLDLSNSCVNECAPGQAVVPSTLALCCRSCQPCNDTLQFTSSYNASHCSECEMEHLRARADHTGCEEIPVERNHWLSSFSISASIVIVVVHGFVVCFSLAVYIRHRATPVVQTTGFSSSVLLHCACLLIIFTTPIQYEAIVLTSNWCLSLQLVPFLLVWITVGLLLERTRKVHILMDRVWPLSAVTGKLRSVMLVAVVVAVGSLILGLRMLGVSLAPMAAQIGRFRRFQVCSDLHWFTELGAYHLVIMILILIMALSTRNESGGFREAWLLAMSSVLVTIVWCISLAVNTAIPIDQKPVLRTAGFSVHVAAIFYPLFTPRLYIMLFRTKDNTMRMAHRQHTQKRKGEDAGRKYTNRNRPRKDVLQRTPSGTSLVNAIIADHQFHGSTDHLCSPTDAGDGLTSMNPTGLRRRATPTSSDLSNRAVSALSDTNRKVATRGSSSSSSSQSARMSLSEVEHSEVTSKNEPSQSYVFTELPVIACHQSPVAEMAWLDEEPATVRGTRKVATGSETVAAIAVSMPASPERSVSPAPTEVDTTHTDLHLRDMHDGPSWKQSIDDEDTESSLSRTSSVHPPSSPGSCDSTVLACPSSKTTSEGLDRTLSKTLECSIDEKDDKVIADADSRL